MRLYLLQLGMLLQSDDIAKVCTQYMDAIKMRVTKLEARVAHQRLSPRSEMLGVYYVRACELQFTKRREWRPLNRHSNMSCKAQASRRIPPADLRLWQVSHSGVDRHDPENERLLLRRLNAANRITFRHTSSEGAWARGEGFVAT